MEKKNYRTKTQKKHRKRKAEKRSTKRAQQNKRRKKSKGARKRQKKTTFWKNTQKRTNTHDTHYENTVSFGQEKSLKVGKETEFGGKNEASNIERASCNP